SHVERYAGLTLALFRAEPEGALDERETELARVAGRTGDDLEVAGRCVRRRNLSRLRERQSQSRLGLLHALADLQDALDLSAATRAARNAQSAKASASDTTGTADASPAARALAPALLRVYERAFSLFMLTEDERGTQSLTRLLDATRSRLYRRHETQTPDETAASAACRDHTGDASCRQHSSSPHSAPQSTSTPRASTPTPTLPTPLSARG
ncbi:MAG: hypothetical protein M3268_03230, partial [Acidobacteriota bacterium]|nr:hypothetical protein [Acidobacteriota bacterium]